MSLLQEALTFLWYGPVGLIYAIVDYQNDHLF